MDALVLMNELGRVSAETNTSVHPSLQAECSQDRQAQKERSSISQPISSSAALGTAFWNRFHNVELMEMCQKVASTMFRPIYTRISRRVIYLLIRSVMCIPVRRDLNEHRQGVSPSAMVEIISTASHSDGVRGEKREQTCIILIVVHKKLKLNIMLVITNAPCYATLSITSSKDLLSQTPLIDDTTTHHPIARWRSLPVHPLSNNRKTPRSIKPYSQRPPPHP